MNLTDVTFLVAMATSLNDPGARLVDKEGGNWNDYWTQPELLGSPLPSSEPGSQIPTGRPQARARLSAVDGGAVNGSLAAVRCVANHQQRRSCEVSEEEVVPCAAPVQPNLPALRRRMAYGPVRPRRGKAAGATASKPFYLIVLAAPFTGSTAAVSLMLTSPEATGLCSRKALCEGMYLLPDYDRPHPDVSPDWNKAFEVWDQVWDQSKAVRVEKSPDWVYPHRVDSLLRFAKHSDRHIGFLVMSRSKCFGFGGMPSEVYKAIGCHDQTSLIAYALEKVKAYGLPHHLVHYEDLVADPYGAAQGIVDAFPALSSLDPSVNGMLMDGGRGPPAHDSLHPQMSLAEYVLRKKHFSNDLKAVPLQAASDAACLGYKAPEGR